MTPTPQPLNGARTRVAGAVVALATLGTLAATPPPPALTASGSSVAAYVAAHRTGLHIVALLLSVAGLAVSVAFERREALCVSIPAMVGGALTAGLAQLPHDTSANVVRAVYLVATEVAYVAPLLGAALLITAVSTRPVAKLLAGACALAAAAALVTVAPAAALAAFAARLSFALWCAIASGATARQPVAGMTVPAVAH